VKKSDKVQELLDAIDRINNVSSQWPQGYANAEIREVLDKGKTSFHEELFELLHKGENKKKRAAAKKASSKPEKPEAVG
jgi:hypothetical protein